MERELRAMLYQFTNGTTPCESHLINKFSKETFSLALELQYIKPCSTNSVGEKLYRITVLGREFRDG